MAMMMFHKLGTKMPPAQWSPAGRGMAQATAVTLHQRPVPPAPNSRTASLYKTPATVIAKADTSPMMREMWVP